MYQKEIDQYKKDSKRVMDDYRSKKFFASWKGMALVILGLPIVLLTRAKLGKSVFAAFALPVLAGTFV